MNRKELLAIATGEGYTGPVDLAKVKAFLDERNIEIKGKDGKAIDIDTAWATKSVIGGDTDPGDEDDGETKTKSVEITPEEAEEFKRLKRAEVQSVRGKGAPKHGEDTGIGALSRMGPVGFARAAAIKSYNLRAKAGKTSFEDADIAEAFGAWFKCTMLPRIASVDDKEIHQKANITTTNTSGGALVPEVFVPSLIDLKELRGVARKALGVTPMVNDTIRLPRRTGGLTVYAPGEASAITESNMTFDTVGITATKLATLTNLSSELLADAALNVGDLTAREIAYAFADKEDDIVFNGDGTSTYFTYTGIRAAIKGLSGTIANIAGLYVGTGNAYSELVLGDFLGTVALAPQYTDTDSPAWYVHKGFYYNTMVRVALGAGGVYAQEVLMTAYSANPMFLGYPVKFVQVMPRVEANSQVCALFGVLSMGAKFGEVRGGMTIATSDQYAFNQDVVTIRGTERIGVTVHDVGNASATAASRVPGPIVGLITAAS